MADQGGVFNESHMRLCYRVAGQMLKHEPDFVDDAAQWAAIYVWRLLRRNRLASEPMLAGAAHWGVMDALRRRRAKQPAGSEVLLSAFDTEDIELQHDPWEQVDLHVVVVAALRAVPDPVERQWLGLRFLEGYTRHEAADVVHRSVSSLDKQWRSRNRTRDRLAAALAGSR